MIYLKSWSGLALLSLLIVKCQADHSIVVSPGAGRLLPGLWGQTFEDINHSGDGGLYAELVRNRAFQKVTPNTPEALDGWHAINNAGLTVIADPNPVSSALPNSLEVKFPPNRFGPIGFGNEGYIGGIKISKTMTFKASFYYRFPNASSFQGNAVVGVQTSTGLSLGSVSVPISGAQTTWKQVSVSFVPGRDPLNNKNWFSVTLDGMGASGQTINFAMFSLFPPTFNNRVNGVRPDLAAALTEMAPSFLRFPGGKNLGNTIDSRWQWNNTVGDLVNRPGRLGTYGYVNTDGLGLFEFLTFCEDIGAFPIMGVWAGFSLDGNSVPLENLFPHIQQAIDQINFAIGPTSTPMGLLRAQLGHPNPFAVKYIEIGNEEFFSSDTYMDRWQFFTAVLSQNFPELNYIATSNANNPVLSPDPTHWDVHAFQTPGWFAHNSFYYDGFERNGTLYFEGEYAATTNDFTKRTDRLLYPTVQSAVSEAAFMTGIERNSDIVIGASYSPLLGREGATQSTPNLISFNADTVIRSTSYYVQMMFSVNNRGANLVQSTLPDPNGTLFWTAAQNPFSSPATYIVKVVNVAPEAEIVNIKLPGHFGGVTLIVLTGDPTASNTPTTPTLVVPVTTAVNLPAFPDNYNYTAPPYSVTIVRAAVFP